MTYRTAAHSCAFSSCVQAMTTGEEEELTPANPTAVALHERAKAVATGIVGRRTTPKPDTAADIVNHKVMPARVGITVDTPGTIVRSGPPAVGRQAVDHVHGVVLILAAGGKIAVGPAPLDKLQPAVFAGGGLVEVGSTHGDAKWRQEEVKQTRNGRRGCLSFLNTA
ncbi:hypothetical protein B0J12DRAFT_247281 [Macrophomina phaseolina]|uniref:Uncharacterized protein n=1 Tax=Macrophomina phaseolina TaxID=35725 RepID=A0ABQ8G0E9_9PEZI|nr:hypothetical protein B0J12DRAFT_247281 [Macrophomina phaseolina]